ncbi:hypothetical protein GE21DRAFT_1008652 [Neurospora crassa]|nr:hypothetical protein GE21DRAFT_1008652 [Neurospora crassa]
MKEGEVGTLPDRYTYKNSRGKERHTYIPYLTLACFYLRNEAYFTLYIRVWPYTYNRLGPARYLSIFHYPQLPRFAFVPVVRKVSTCISHNRLAKSPIPKSGNSDRRIHKPHPNERIPFISNPRSQCVPPERIGSKTPSSFGSSAVQCSVNQRETYIRASTFDSREEGWYLGR